MNLPASRVGHRVFEIRPFRPRQAGTVSSASVAWHVVSESNWLVTFVCPGGMGGELVLLCGGHAIYRLIRARSARSARSVRGAASFRRARSVVLG